MRDLRLEPAWKAEDLGTPLPDGPHACSVCLPTWDSTVGYEEGRPEVVDRLRTGYPRFLLNSFVETLFAEASSQLGVGDGEACVVFPSPGALSRAAAYVAAHGGGEVRETEACGLPTLVVAREDQPLARNYWKHTGEIVSSRLAEDALAGTIHPGSGAGARAQLAAVLEVPDRDLFLYESGMAAIFAGYEIAVARRPERKTLQVDFPYVDALKIQQQFGAGSEFLPNAHGEAFTIMLERVRAREFAAVFCEVPSNPLLRSVNLMRLSEVCRASATPLLVDDTICSHHNLGILPLADVVTTSLTKWVSGYGDVMAGSLKLNADSPLHAELSGLLKANNPSQTRLYARDLEVLAANSAGFVARVERSNVSGETLAEFLLQHPAVSQVWYPKFSDRANYEALARPQAGFGGLMSFTLKDPASTPGVYDRLRWNKGPSLGTEFSLACAYTLLAHYHELDWAESCGVPRNLVRLSVGLEDPAVLQGALSEALGGA